MQLLVKQITVNHLGPKRDDVPAKEGVFKTKIRTSWYLVNVELFATDLLARVSKEGRISSDFSQIGSPGMAQTRTSFTLEMTVGIPLLRWGEGPFVSHPVPYPTNCLDAAKVLVPDVDTPRSPFGHPIHMALKWRQMLDDDPSLSMAQIARNQNVSRARITQIMKLLSLPQGIQDCLIAINSPAEIAYLTEHKMRAVGACASAETQMRMFLEIQNTFRLSGAV